MSQMILRLLGLDFQTLTFAYESRDESLASVTLAHVLIEVLAEQRA